ncbi:cupin domain-containing protein [Limnoglobus roseus]|uniref:Cupin n=1 Tax=Limnoglobus roseus TaxID=2598579 RepID=A0A5C1AW99_9BACT|nr:cupin domain-containing protein [Limnoglobus roseus]QEL21068.1 cupin [Limnoglobus roseus]
MPFVDLEAIPRYELLPGVRIRTPFGQHVMLSYLEMDEGAVVPTHRHPHEQAGMLLQGRMELTIGDETRIVEPGAMFIIPPNVPHRAVAVGGPVVALVIFSPPREDYIALQNQYIPAAG